DLNLDEQWEVRAGNLSGGQRRCLSVMLAFAGGPELVVLDEPSTGLDESARRKLSQAILGARNPSRAILVSTHYMDEAEYIADEVVLLDDGQLIAKGSVPELTSSLDSSLVLRVIFRPNADPSQCITLLARKLAANGIHSQLCGTAGRSASIGLRRESSIKEQDKALRTVEDSLDELQIETFSVSTVNLGHFFDW
ncbi:ATP-binding cassette sub- A member 3, partial [Perkinsus olseni]